jgi:hypothetical protein
MGCLPLMAPRRSWRRPPGPSPQGGGGLLKAALCIPLSVGGKFIGALTLSSLRSHQAWDPGLAQKLRPIGEIFANTLIRRVADNALRQGELKYRIVADFTYDWEYWQNPDSTGNSWPT